MRVASYLRPERMSVALAALADMPWTILAGGTDFYPARVGRPLDEDVLDITAIAELRGIRREGAGWRIPALVTWTEIAEDEGLPPLFDGLKEAARAIGGVQIQNAGTLCGNICNASPAADGVPNLLALDAEVELVSKRGARRLPLDAFITGNRATSRAGDELVGAVIIPDPGPACSAFLKLGTRKYLVISIVMAAIVLAVEKNRVAAARIAIGACSAVARRLPALEAALAGRALSPALAEIAEAAHLAPLAPIDDVRGTAAYRREAALTLIRRGLAELGQ